MSISEILFGDRQRQMAALQSQPDRLSFMGQQTPSLSAQELSALQQQQGFAQLRPALRKAQWNELDHTDASYGDNTDCEFKHRVMVESDL